MIDHKVIWPELGVEITFSQDEESQTLQRTIKSYSGDSDKTEKSDAREEFERKLNENTRFRRFLIGLSFLRSGIEIVFVGILAILSLAIFSSHGGTITGPAATFWAGLLGAIAIFVIDEALSNFWKSPLWQLSTYSSGVIAVTFLGLYYLIKQDMPGLEELAEIATMPVSTTIMLEEMVETGRRFNY